MRRVRALVVGLVLVFASVSAVQAYASAPIGTDHSGMHAVLSVIQQDQTFNLRRAYRDSVDNLDAIVALEQRIRCTCGCNLDVHTCRTTDFSCTTSPAMHGQVLRMWEQGTSADDIVAAFVAEHGEYVLMAPPKKGFNLAGYLVPFAALILGAFVIITFLKRQRALTAQVVPTGGPEAEPAKGDLEQLQRELDRFES